MEGIPQKDNDVEKSHQKELEDNYIAWWEAVEKEIAAEKKGRIKESKELGEITAKEFKKLTDAIKKQAQKDGAEVLKDVDFFIHSRKVGISRSFFQEEFLERLLEDLKK